MYTNIKEMLVHISIYIYIYMNVEFLVCFFSVKIRVVLIWWSICTFIPCKYILQFLLIYSEMFIKSCLKADICGRWRKRWKGMTFQVEGSFKVHFTLFTLYIACTYKNVQWVSAGGELRYHTIDCQRLPYHTIPYLRLPKIASSSEGSCHVMEGSFTLITQSQATTLGSDAWIKCWRVSIWDISIIYE